MKLENDEMARLISDASKHVRPIMVMLDGGKIRFKGSGTLLQHGQTVLMLTAEHVLKDERSARIGIPNELPVNLIPGYGVIRSRSIGVEDPDIAFVGVGAKSKLRGSDSGFFEYQRGLSLTDPFAPQQYLAAGIPASRAKTWIGRDWLDAEMMFGAFEAKPQAWYTENGIDPTTHIAVTYKRDAVTTPSGAAAFGSDPHGMSGGPLLVVGDAQGARCLYPAGILTEYREKQGFALVAVRIHTVIDCLFPHTSLPESRFFAASATDSLKKVAIDA